MNVRKNESASRIADSAGAALHLPDDQLPDGPGAVHLREELRLPDLQPVMHVPVGAGEHRVVVAPAEPEDLDLAAVPETRTLPHRVEVALELVEEPDLDLGRLDERASQSVGQRGRRVRVLGEARLKDAAQVDGADRPQPPLPDAV